MICRYRRGALSSIVSASRWAPAFAGATMGPSLRTHPFDRAADPASLGVAAFVAGGEVVAAGELELVDRAAGSRQRRRHPLGLRDEMGEVVAAPGQEEGRRRPLDVVDRARRAFRLSRGIAEEARPLRQPGLRPEIEDAG